MTSNNTSSQLFRDLSPLSLQYREILFLSLREILLLDYLSPLLLFSLRVSSIVKRSCLHFTNLCSNSSRSFRGHLPKSYFFQIVSRTILVFDILVILIVNCPFRKLYFFLRLDILFPFYGQTSESSSWQFKCFQFRSFLSLIFTVTRFSWSCEYLLSSLSASPNLSLNYYFNWFSSVILSESPFLVSDRNDHVSTSRQFSKISSLWTLSFCYHDEALPPYPRRSPWHMRDQIFVEIFLFPIDHILIFLSIIIRSQTLSSQSSPLSSRFQTLLNFNRALSLLSRTLILVHVTSSSFFICCFFCLRSVNTVAILPWYISNFSVLLLCTDAASLTFPIPWRKRKNATSRSHCAASCLHVYSVSLGNIAFLTDLATAINALLNNCLRPSSSCCSLIFASFFCVNLPFALLWKFVYLFSLWVSSSS